MNNQRTEISVIIPVYNVEQYIDRCLSSVINQTFHNIEIIVVIDGSEDGSERICEEYAKNDQRIKIIRQENKGLAAARNTGLEYASGKYVMFVDSDDYVESDFCGKPYKVAIVNNSDLVMFRFSKRNKVNEEFPEGIVNNEEAINLMLGECDYASWNKFYKKTLFDNIKYPEGRNFEDVATTYRIIHKAKRIFYINDILYHHCFRKESITNTYSKDNINNWFEAHRKQENDLIQMGYCIKKWSNKNRALHYLIKMGFNERFSDDCMAILEDNNSDDAMPFKRKILYSIYCFSPCLFEFFCVVFDKRKAK